MDIESELAIIDADFDMQFVCLLKEQGYGEEFISGYLQGRRDAVFAQDVEMKYRKLGVFREQGGV